MSRRPRASRGRFDESGGGPPGGPSLGHRLLVRIATDRPLLLIFLIVVLIAVMAILEPATFPARQTRPSCFSTRRRPASWRAG